MTIAQRIELRRLGYTKEEVNQLAELEKVPEPETNTARSEDPAPENVPEPQTANPEPAQDTTMQGRLLEAITNLTAVLQTQKLNNTPQPEPAPPETAQDIFNNILKG